jgi:membrane glycosyltransferase
MSESQAGAPALPNLVASPSPTSGRRLLFAGLVVATIIAVMGLMTVALAADGLDGLDFALLGLFLVTLPWTVIGFWNAAIGFLILRFAADPVAAVTPAVARIRGDEPIAASVALIVCIRHEDPARVIRNLAPMLDGLVPVGDRFHLYVLSDTSDPATAAAEEARFRELTAEWRERVAITYRRRDDNAGFKAGNIRDFCLRWGSAHDFAVTLDADSFIPASAILRMVRIMQASPEIGILQGLVVGMPSTSAFAHIFQFGMRLAMWSYTTGSAWWQGDCGPHWGHNSVLRLKPFIAHCHIPPLPEGGPLGGHILSHDQIEAVLMRRAGYEVRVLPEEHLGWEENPPTLLEFIRRDIRWCQGNMQYWHFLKLPRLKFVSRYQLAFAILMFLGSPAWMGLLVLGTIGVVRAERPSAFIAPGAGLAVLVIILVMWFAPKIATVIDALTRAQARRRYGGGWRFLVNVFAETIFFLLLSPIMWFAHTVFLATLVFGGSVGWGGQARDDHAVSWSDALAALWPQTVLGWACIGALAVAVPVAVPYALLIAGGLALAVPLCVITASPAVGAALMRGGIGRLPEEIAPSPLDALGLPALEMARRNWHGASSPSPLLGEGLGGGSGGSGKAVPHLPTPTPDPSPQGGGEKETRSAPS